MGRTPAPAGAYDLNGNLRTLDDDIDIGAYEDVSAVPGVLSYGVGTVTAHTAVIDSVVTTQGARPRPWSATASGASA